jgi:hypothetical protein
MEAAEIVPSGWKGGHSAMAEECCAEAISGIGGGGQYLGSPAWMKQALVLWTWYLLSLLQLWVS